MDGNAGINEMDVDIVENADAALDADADVDGNVV